MKKVIDSLQQEENWKEKGEAFMLIHPFTFMLWFNYVLVLGTFPALIFYVGIGMEPTHGFPLIVTIFNLGDLLGKYCYR